jgi:hypothetical protein
MFLKKAPVRDQGPLIGDALPLLSTKAADFIRGKILFYREAESAAKKKTLF